MRRAGRPDARHHCVAGIDAEAHWIQPRSAPPRISTPGRADVHALVAVDAIPSGKALLPKELALLYRSARLAAVVPVRDVKRIFVGQRRLDARPRTHIKTDLLAHVAGERIGRSGQDFQSTRRPRPAPARSRDPSPALARREKYKTHAPPGPPCHHQPQEMLRCAARDLVKTQRCAVPQQMLAPVALDKPFDCTEKIGPHRFADTGSRTTPGRRPRSSGTAPGRR